MKDLSRPYLNIKKGSQPTDAYKQGKAIALLFVLEAHERVNLVEQFRTYFGLKRQCNTELCA